MLIMQDDYGWHDVGLHNDEAEPFSSNISGLARQGIVLDRHYAFYICAPSRRSFLTGRNVVHHGQQLGDIADNIDLRFNLISQKLETVGYHSYFLGKGLTLILSLTLTLTWPGVAWGARRAPRC